MIRVILVAPGNTQQAGHFVPRQGTLHSSLCSLTCFFLVLDVGIGVVVTAVIVVVVSVIADIIARRRDRHGRGVRDEYFPD